MEIPIIVITSQDGIIIVDIIIIDIIPMYDKYLDLPNQPKSAGKRIVNPVAAMRCALRRIYYPFPADKKVIRQIKYIKAKTSP